MGLSCAIRFVPGGAKSVSLISNAPWNLGAGGQSRVDAGCAEKIESDEGLLEDLIPKEEREILISGADAGNQMFF